MLEPHYVARYIHPGPAGGVAVTLLYPRRSLTLALLASLSACHDSPATLIVMPSTLVLTRLRESRQLSVEARDRDGAVLSDAEVRWRSSDTTVAEVEPTGKVVAVRSGRATITADCGDAVTEVPVLVAVYDKLRVETTVLRMILGESKLIEAHVLDEKGLPIAGRVDFKSSDERVARVDVEGNVVAVGPGMTAIMLTAQELMAAVPVAVSPGVVAQVLSDVASLEVKVGEVRILEARAMDAAGKPVPVILHWSSSDPTVLAVSDDGRITGVRAGESLATVTHAESGRGAAVRVRVAP